MPMTAMIEAALDSAKPLPLASLSNFWQSISKALNNFRLSDFFYG